jgi:acetolactate synthase I/II/III large subunit
MIARAMGAYGERVTESEKLPGALQRALAAVKSGQPAVLDTIITNSEVGEPAPEGRSANSRGRAGLPALRDLES